MNEHLKMTTAADRYRNERGLLDRLSLIEALLARREDHENQSTPADAGPLLDRVLQEISAIQPAANATNHTGDCNLQGFWLSESAGGMFKFPAFAGAAGQEMPVDHIKVRDHVHNGFMKIKNWNTTLLYPFEDNSQYVIINAVDGRDKIVATFMGECRLCRKREILQGNWLIVSHSRDCESLGTTAKLISDVLRRDNIDKLHKQHLGLIKAKKAHKHIPLERTNPPPSAVHSTMPSHSDSKEENLGNSEATPKKSKPHKSTMLPIKLH